MGRICNSAEIAPGTSRGFRLAEMGQDDFFLVNLQGKFFAYRNSCPHWPGATLPFRKDQYLDEQSHHIVCRGHAALFDIKTGICISGPCVGERLQAVELVIDEAGDIFIATPSALSKIAILAD
jgi:nitrite reductase/ring-hydroxylating ferredoxin subunit